MDISKRTAARRREQAVDWLMRRQEGALTASEAQAFRAWLADSRNRAVYEEAHRLMGDARSAILGDPALAAYEPRPSRPAARNLAVLLIAGGAGLFLALDGAMWLRADAIAGIGERPVITLEDGSLVQLNARSAVAFEFDEGKRTVQLLRGEAFFQVAPDPERPFAVEAGGGRAVALGTAFNVRIGEEGVAVTVVEHKVRVTNDSSPDVVDVGEGEAIGFVAGNVGAIRPAVEGALAWRDGRLIADNMLLEDVVAEIGRYQAGAIFIPDAALAKRRVSGAFTISDPQSALDVLRQTLGLDIVRFGPVTLVRG